MNSRDDITIYVLPSCQGVLGLSTAPRPRYTAPVVGQRRVGDVEAQLRQRRRGPQRRSPQLCAA